MKDFRRQQYRMSVTGGKTAGGLLLFLRGWLGLREDYPTSADQQFMMDWFKLSSPEGPRDSNEVSIC